MSAGAVARVEIAEERSALSDRALVTLLAGAVLLPRLLVFAVNENFHGDAVVRAIETVVREGPRTRDMGGKASTSEMGKAIAEALR